MSSMKAPTIVTSTMLAERPDGSRLLTIESKTGPVEYEFTAELWEKLADTARWFAKCVTTIQ